MYVCCGNKNNSKQVILCGTSNAMWCVRYLKCCRAVYVNAQPVTSLANQQHGMGPVAKATHDATSVYNNASAWR